MWDLIVSVPDHRLIFYFGKQCNSCHVHYRTLSAFFIDSNGNQNSLITSEIDNI